MHPTADYQPFVGFRFVFNYQSLSSSMLVRLLTKKTRTLAFVVSFNFQVPGAINLYSPAVLDVKRLAKAELYPRAHPHQKLKQIFRLMPFQGLRDMRFCICFLIIFWDLPRGRIGPLRALKSNLLRIKQGRSDSCLAERFCRCGSRFVCV